MELKAGTLENFKNSMAAAIEKAFEKVWCDQHETVLPEDTRDDRRVLFVAIAQGVIRHLYDNAQEGFDVAVAVKQQFVTGPYIQVSGETDSAGGWYSHMHNIDHITQDEKQADGSDNRAMSEGEGHVTIQTTGELYP